MGLGLSIVRHLTAEMGGLLAVESEPGVGTTFALTASFPIVQREGRDEAQGRSSAPPAAASLRVLVVEDNRTNQRVAAGLLGKLGHAATLASGGREAIDALAAEPFDLVLMDVLMPEMDGVEATRRIRAGEAGQAAASVPIIALTASATAGDRTACLAAGMTEFVAKPITLKSLASALEPHSATDRPKGPTKETT